MQANFFSFNDIKQLLLFFFSKEIETIIKRTRGS